MMKKALKNILLFVFVFVFVFCQNNASIVNADEHYDLEQHVKTLLKDCDVERTINACVPLYASDETVVGFLYKLLPKGYVIVLCDGQITEFSLESNLDNLTKAKKIYYTGPISYYTKDGDLYVDLKTNKQVSYTNITVAEEKFLNKVAQISSTTRVNNETKSTVSPRIEIIDSDYKTTYTPATYNNSNNSCGPIACAILLKYYDDYVNGNVLSAYYNTSSGSRLINYFQNIVDPEESGSNYNDLTNGINSYMDSVGLRSTYGANKDYTLTFEEYKTKIKRNRPVIIGTQGHALYEDHWVIGYGYFMSNPATYVIVNNGWGSNNVRINFNYIEDMVYLNN